MVLILYGSERSPAVRVVLLTLKALDLQYELKPINMQLKEHLTPEYLAKNPQHTIPTIEDDGKSIWDSHAIVTYLVDKYGKDDSLYPKDLYLRAHVNQRLFFEDGTFSQKTKAAMQSVFRGSGDVTSIPPEAIEEINVAYGFLEAFLGDHQYLVGNNVTVADFSNVVKFSNIQRFAPVDSTKFPKLAAWYERLQKLPYYYEANGKAVAAGPPQRPTK